MEAAHFVKAAATELQFEEIKIGSACLDDPLEQVTTDFKSFTVTS